MLDKKNSTHTKNNKSVINSNLKSNKYIIEQMLPSNYIQLQNLSKSMNDNTTKIKQKHNNNNINNSYFQSFVYTDHITNNKLSLQNQKSNYNCLGLMKSTKKFHLNSLKSRNYRLNRINNSSVMSQNISQQNIQYFGRQSKKYSKRKLQQRQQFEEQKRQLSRVLSKNKSYLTFSLNTSVQQSPRKIQNISNIYDIQRSNQQNLKNQDEDKHDHTANQNTEDPYKNKSQAQVLQQFQRCMQKEKEKQQRTRIINQYKNQPEVRQLLSKNEQQILKKLNRQLRQQITKNIQYLITPNQTKLNLISKPKIKKNQNQNINKDKDKENIQTKQQNQYMGRIRNNLRRQKMKLLQAQASKQQTIQIQSPSKSYDQEIKEQLQCYKFKFQSVDQLLNINQSYLIPQKQGITARQPRTKKLQANTLNIIQLIKQGNYFKTQIQLSLDPALLNVKQGSNNLLHLCIIYDKPQIFLMILQKCLENNAYLYEQVNKYSKNPIQAMKTYKYFYNKCQKIDKFNKLLMKIM